MAITLPNLDDKTFEQLMEEARAVIPRYSREWTNFNPSDPGITLLELFAWINEMIIYRQNKITRKTKWELLKMIMPAPQTAFVELEYTGDTNELLNSHSVLRDDSSTFRFFLPESKTVTPGDNRVRFYAFRNDPEFGPETVVLNHNFSEANEKLLTIPLLSLPDEYDEQYDSKLTQFKRLAKYPLIHHVDLRGDVNPYNTCFRPNVMVSCNGEVKTFHFRDDLIDITDNEKYYFTFDYHRRAIQFRSEDIETAFTLKDINDEQKLEAVITVSNLFFGAGTDTQIARIELDSFQLFSDTGDARAIEYTIRARPQDGENWYLGENGELLDEKSLDMELLKATIRRSKEFHSAPYFRSVTQEDYATAAKEAILGTDVVPAVTQAWSIENYNVHKVRDLAKLSANMEEHDDVETNYISLLVLNRDIYKELISANTSDEEEYVPNAKYRESFAVWDASKPTLDHGDLISNSISAVDGYVQRRKQVATTVYTEVPRIQDVAVSLTIKLLPNTRTVGSSAKEAVMSAIINYLDPLNIGVGHAGRRPGETLFKSEIFTLVEKLDFIDVVEALKLSRITEIGKVEEEFIELEPYQLPYVHMTAIDVKISG